VERAVFAKPELSGKEEPDRVIAARHLSLLPLHRAAVFFHTGKLDRTASLTPALRPVATKVSPSFPSPLWMPCPSSRGGKRRRLPPHRHACRWECRPSSQAGKDLARAAAVVAVRAALLVFPPLFLLRVSRLSRHVAVAVSTAAVAVTPACMRAL
jgi:hypothetical protein